MDVQIIPNPTKITTLGMTTSTTSRLPVEIWREVLLYSTNLPGELGITEWKGSYDSLELARLDFSYTGKSNGSQGQFSHLSTMRALRTQLEFRAGLSSVSHFWHELTIPFLYRTVVIRGPTDLEALYGLASTAGIIASSIRRIHIQGSTSSSARNGTTRTIPSTGNTTMTATNATSHSTVVNGLHFNRLVDSLIASCPNLDIFQDVWCRNGFSNWSPTRKAILTRRLHYLHGCDATVPFSTMDSIALIRDICTFSALRALVLPQLHVILMGSYPPLTLPSLEILDVGRQVDITESIVAWIVGGSLPLLHTLHLSPASQPNVVFEALRYKLGRQLHTLHIDLKSFQSITSFSSIFPSLKQLILCPLTADEFGEIPLVHQINSNDEIGISGVEILELNFMKGIMHITSDHVEQAIKIARSMPCLRILRFRQMLESTSQVAQMKENIELFERYLVSRGVGVENKVYYRDCDDDRLLDASSLSNYLHTLPSQIYLNNVYSTVDINII